MLRKILIVLIFTLPLLTVQAQKMNRVVTDSASQEEILYGPCDRQGLENFGEFGPFMLEGFHQYEPDQDAISRLSEMEREIEFIIVLGTWCDDSREQVPRIYKVLEMSGFEVERIKVIAVDRQKKAEGTEVAGLNIEKVPTLIIMFDGKELGRIIETPKASLENDILNILLGNMGEQNTGPDSDMK